MKIASIFYYLCVVTLQYVAPIIMCMYFALMYKTLGGYKWTDLYRTAELPDDECSATEYHPPIVDVIMNDADILTTAKMSLKGLKSVRLVDTVRDHEKLSFKKCFFPVFRCTGFHHRSLSRFVRICNMVELFRVVRRIITGHGVSVLFLQSLNLIFFLEYNRQWCHRHFIEFRFWFFVSVSQLIERFASLFRVISECFVYFDFALFSCLIYVFSSWQRRTVHLYQKIRSLIKLTAHICNFWRNIVEIV